MKTIHGFTATIILLFMMLSFQGLATVHRVNNTGVDADFTSIQAAHNAALNGDSLYIESSSVSYGNITITKEIHLIGTGYFLSQNLNLQASLPSATIGNIYLGNGSDNTTIQGLTIYLIQSINTTTIQNVLVHRNNISAIYLGSTGSVENMYIIENIIAGSTANYFSIKTFGTSLKTLTINNNIFEYISTYSRISLLPSVSATLKNNVFNLYSITSTNCEFKNNILVYNGIVDNTGMNTFYNNLCPSTQFPSGNGNIQNVNINSVFFGYPSQGSYSDDARYQLTGGSPALGAGEAGIDCGAFDGDTSYVLSGIPSIPTIYKLIAPSVVTGNFNITLSTRSNN